MADLTVDVVAIQSEHSYYHAAAAASSSFGRDLDLVAGRAVVAAGGRRRRSLPLILPLPWSATLVRSLL